VVVRCIMLLMVHIGDGRGDIRHASSDRSLLTVIPEMAWLPRRGGGSSLSWESASLLLLLGSSTSTTLTLKHLALTAASARRSFAVMRSATPPSTLSPLA